MKKYIVLIFLIFHCVLLSFGQKYHLLDYLNLSKESLTVKLLEQKIDYFWDETDTMEYVLHLKGDEGSVDPIKRLNINIFLKDSTVYKLDFLCLKQDAGQIRKHLGIDVASIRVLPVKVTFGSYLYDYYESVEQNFTHIIIENSSTQPESTSAQVIGGTVSGDYASYVSLLNPQLPSLPKSKQKILEYMYGAWLVVIVEAEIEKQVLKYQGELLGTKNDSIILLSNGSMTNIFIGDIEFAGIYTHKNNAAKWGLYTVAAYTPNIITAIANPEYAGQFLLIGTPVILVGMINMFAVLGTDTPVLYYPGDVKSLAELNMFSRFPQGIPPDFNVSIEIYKK